MIGKSHKNLCDIVTYKNSPAKYKDFVFISFSYE